MRIIIAIIEWLTGDEKRQAALMESRLAEQKQHEFEARAFYPRKAPDPRYWIN